MKWLRVISGGPTVFSSFLCSHVKIKLLSQCFQEKVKKLTGGGAEGNKTHLWKLLIYWCK